ncbi:DEAD/DEAH box helicase [Blastococcus montanus]|uniref:DEAD/DEAH box helicase n=1 Tax=Blastococcus montanus TaxID=3144973 RepID=UPI00320B4898
MERALNRELLDEALGTHTPGVLPTVEELTALIANVEIQAFRRDFTVTDELLRPAWYLHGVASATQAPELYSRPRQRRAFAVSAHIFDLALNDLTRGRHDRLTLTFAAQVGYRRAEFDPNATAVYRRVTDLLRDDEDIVDNIDILALQAGVAFLGLEPRRLSRLQARWRRQLAALADEVGLQNLVTTMFGPAEQIVLATSALLAYLRSGDASQLETARIALVSVLDLTAGEGDHDARWVAAHLLQIADSMQTSSIWTVLPPDTPAAVAQSFTVGSPAVLTLWPPQRDLLASTAQNPLDPATRRLLLSVPTSAGKTLLAQITICTHLATQRGDVCYVTPLRSLGREMRQALASRLRVLNRELGPDVPDFTTASFDDILAYLTESGRGDVEVMTPERLMQQLRRDPQGVLDRFSLFIIDEAHLLAQPGRGFLLESLLGFLSAGDARLVLLSGVLGNAGSLASWIAPDQPEALYTSDWRGPRRMHALLYTQPKWEEAEQRARRSKKRPVRVTVPLIGRLRVRPAEGQTVDLVSRESLGTLALNRAADGGDQERDGGASTPVYRMVASFASLLLHAGSLLMIVSTRSLARSAAEALAERLEVAPATRELAAYLEERLGPEHPLIGCVRRGVAFHHAGLPVDVLDAVEEAIRSDQLLAVVATSTLTDGVNLPVRTVLISETEYEGQQAGAKLDAPRLLNAVGRAGRAGRETEGWIVLALNKSPQLADFARLRPEAAALEARSTLLSDDALDSLAAAESLIAETAGAILKLPPGPAADFAVYVWFVLSALDRLESIAAAPDVAAAVQRLLGYQQMSQDLRDRWLAFAAQVQETYGTTDPVRRQRWAASGTSLSTAVRLDEIVAELVGAVTAAYPAAPDPFEDPVDLGLEETLRLLTGGNRLEALLTLPEADGAWRFRGRRNGGEAVSVSIGPALSSWMGGADIPQLAQQMLPTISDGPWRLEQTVDAVSTAFEHFLSWMVGVVVEQANARLTEVNAGVRLRPDLAWLIRFGVDTPQAVALLTSGIQSRRLAYRLGRVAHDQDMGDAELREWLGDLHIAGWRTEFNASPREVLDLLEFTRARRRSLLRSLLETGSGSVAVRRAGDVDTRDPTEARSVILRTAARATELSVLDGETVLGVVAASDHSEAEAVLASGLDVTTVLAGDTLTFNVFEGAGQRVAAEADPVA